MAIILQSDSKDYASVTNEGYLEVCLCEKTCDYRASLKRLLDEGYQMLLYVEDENGNIKPIKM